MSKNKLSRRDLFKAAVVAPIAAGIGASATQYLTVPPASFSGSGTYFPGDLVECGGQLWVCQRHCTVDVKYRWPGMRKKGENAVWRRLGPMADGGRPGKWS